MPLRRLAFFAACLASRPHSGWAPLTAARTAPYERRYYVRHHPKPKDRISIALVVKVSACLGEDARLGRGHLGQGLGRSTTGAVRTRRRSPKHRSKHAPCTLGHAWRSASVQGKATPEAAATPTPTTVPQVGSVVEEEAERGVAHIVEHLAFNATEVGCARGLPCCARTGAGTCPPHAVRGVLMRAP